MPHTRSAADNTSTSPRGLRVERRFTEPGVDPFDTVAWEIRDAVITVDDEVAYEFLILGMDTLNQSGFPAVSVSTVAAE